MDISAIALGAAITLSGDDTVQAARLVFGGMAATTQRAKGAEAALVGKPWSVDTIRAAMRALDTDFTPLSDHRGSAEYRRAVAANLLMGLYEEAKTAPNGALPAWHAGTVLPGDDEQVAAYHPAPTHHEGAGSPLHQPSAHESGLGTPPARRSTSRTSPPGATASSSSSSRPRTPTLGSRRVTARLRSKYLACAPCSLATTSRATP